MIHKLKKTKRVIVTPLWPYRPSVRYHPYWTRSRSDVQDGSNEESTSAQPSLMTARSSLSTMSMSFDPPLPLPKPKAKAKKLRLSSKDLNAAQDRLLEIAGEEGRTGVQAIVLAENVPLDVYLRYCESNRKLSVRVYLDHGKVMAHEVPDEVHGMVAGLITGLMFNWNSQDLWYSYNSTMIIGGNVSYEPDGWVRPKRLPRQAAGQGMNSRDSSYPTMVIEVGYSQSLDEIHAKVAGYLSPRTSIRIVLAIKLFRARVDNTFSMIAMQYLRSSPTPLIPVDVRSFGTANPDPQTITFLQVNAQVSANSIIGVGRTDANGARYSPCNMAGLATYQMNINAADLFHGDPLGIPAAAVGGFNLDLWEVQQVVLEALL